MNPSTTSSPADETSATPSQPSLIYAQLMQKQDEMDERIAELERLATDLAGQIKELR